MATRDATRRGASWGSALFPPAGVARRLLRALTPWSLRVRVRAQLLETPFVSDLVYAVDARYAANRVRGAHVIIDGMPRSANTYARYAFDHVNEGRFRAATHFHSSRAVASAVRRGVPVIVLLRHPRPVLESYLRYEPRLTAAFVLHSYLRYYARVERLLDRVVVAAFTDVVTDFGAVTARCNEKFGVGFAEYAKSPDSEAAISARLRADAIAAVGDRHEQMGSLPRSRPAESPSRADALSDREARALRRCEALYERLRERG